MTVQKHFKQLVRNRMKSTGERYAAARRLTLQSVTPTSPHRAGNVAGATALRIQLAKAGLNISEAMAFGLAGGIGIGVCSFYYQKANVSTFFTASRHLWHDHLAYLTNAGARLGLKPVVKETGSAGAAEKQLRAMLGEHGPCVAWVDLGALPHRGMPASEMTSGYHLITVYALDDDAGTASIGDLTDEPVNIALDDLTAARGRIKKDKHRLLALTGTPKFDAAKCIPAALTACVAGLRGDGAPKGWQKNFSLDALNTWADRLTSTKDKDRWAVAFAPGANAWNGMFHLHLFTEYGGTGGGLSRPLMADFLAEAAKTCKRPEWNGIAKQYAKLGEQWSDLTDAALPDDVSPFAEAKKLLANYAELLHSNDSIAEKQAIWSRLKEIEKQVAKKFPLTDDEYAALRTELRDRVVAIHAGEVAARDELEKASR